MCAVSGRHMVLDDWCFCPVSKCPVLFSEYIRYIEADILAAKEKAGEFKEEGKTEVKETANDPVMRKPVAVVDLKLCPPEEAVAYIKRYNNVLEEKKVNLEDSTDGTGVGGGVGGESGSPAKREEPPKVLRNAY